MNVFRWYHRLRMWWRNQQRKRALIARKWQYEADLQAMAHMPEEAKRNMRALIADLQRQIDLL